MPLAAHAFTLFTASPLAGHDSHDSHVVTIVMGDARYPAKSGTTVTTVTIVTIVTTFMGEANEGSKTSTQLF